MGWEVYVLWLPLLWTVCLGSLHVCRDSQKPCFTFQSPRRAASTSVISVLHKIQTIAMLSYLHDTHAGSQWSGLLSPFLFFLPTLDPINRMMSLSGIPGNSTKSTDIDIDRATTVYLLGFIPCASGAIFILELFLILAVGFLLYSRSNRDPIRGQPDRPEELNTIASNGFHVAMSLGPNPNP